MKLSYRSTSPVILTDCKVSAAGDFGTIVWTLSQQMHDILPANDRDEILALKSRLDIVPTMNNIAKAVIMAASGARPLKNPTHVDFQPLKCKCEFGSFTWELGSMFEVVPAEYQREIYDHGAYLGHNAFELDFCPSLAKFVGKYFPEYDHMYSRVYPKV